MLFRIGKLKLAENEGVRVGDPCYFNGSLDATQLVELGWPAGEYPVFVEVEEGSSYVRPEALILGDAPYYAEFAQIGNLLGVDSGQMAFIAESILPTWTQDRSELPDFDNPQDDYENACVATLRNQLTAGWLRSRLVAEKPDFSNPANMTATAFASGTKFGDGQYPLLAARTSDGKISALKVAFNGSSDNPYEDEDEWDIEDDEEDYDDFEDDPYGM